MFRMLRSADQPRLNAIAYRFRSHPFSASCRAVPHQWPGYRRGLGSERIPRGGPCGQVGACCLDELRERGLKRWSKNPFADSRWRALTGFETRKPRRQVMRYSRPCASWFSRFRRSFSASSQGLQSRIVVLLRSDKRNSVGDIDRCCRKTFAKRSPFPNPAWRAILSAGNSVSANS